MATIDPKAIEAADPYAALQGQLDVDTDAYQDLVTQGKDLNAQKFEQPEPVSNMQSVMSVAPYLMGIAALGGKLAGVHSKVMLGATDGMMQGLLKGSEQQYKDARRKYDTAYQQWHDKWSEQNRLFQEMRQVYKGRVDADLRALEFARKVTGDEAKVTQNDVKNHLEAQRIGTGLINANERITHNRNTEQISVENSKRTADTALAKSTAATSKKTAEAAAAKSDVVNQIDKLIAQIDSQEGLGITGAGGMASRALEVGKTATGLGDQTAPAHQFQSAMQSLMVQLPKVLTGSGKSAKDERQRVDEIANALRLGSTKAISKAKLMELKSIIEKQPAPEAEAVQVNSAEEAAALPPGTVFLTPDGRRKVR